ncbi:uncharacterized protein LOC115449965 isoform X1 [Manduca sexta]|uniref:uncharacterized protein LOC115449965 isoform X1 n=1 Tax=Manduca sexta TaxID=7130 RepID=UPI00188EA881|nr:uncharacterized protein LOC115449965 isoform X1 [Manduca sexta]
MWKLTLLVAIVANLATSYGSEYMDRLTMTMSEAINSRFSCSNFVTDEYTEQCDEIHSGYDIDVLKKQYDQANSGLGGTCIYQLKRTHAEPQITSVSALIKLMSQICLNAQGLTRTQCYNLLNFNNNEEMRYFVPKIDDVFPKSQDFISTVKTVIFARSDNDFSEHFKSCFGQLAKGETKVIDFGNLENVANAINQWFNASSLYYEEVVTADDIDDDVVMMTGSHHHVEVAFKDFNFKEQVDHDFIISKDNIVSQKLWSGEGYGKVSYNEELGATVLQIALKGDRQAIILHPKVGGLEDMLFKLRDSSVVLNLNAETEWEYINVVMPINEHNYGKENFVDGLKLANQISLMYLPGFDGFRGIFENQSGHLSHMFHTMYMKVNGLGASENPCALENLEPKHTVNIDSAFAYYVVNSGSPEIIGTWWY